MDAVEDFGMNNKQDLVPVSVRPKQYPFEAPLGQWTLHIAVPGLFVGGC